MIANDACEAHMVKDSGELEGIVDLVKENLCIQDIPHTTLAPAETTVPTTITEPTEVGLCTQQHKTRNTVLQHKRAYTHSFTSSPKISYHCLLMQTTIGYLGKEVPE